ncbi:hypothetical protein ESA94_20450 [Lacibacter luteus]|uniref:Phage late control D family protein n=1 Tax=Lacibacter luteus TaxID=2508719 RepID=A0A4Q1CDY2_9BACT|nr:hypothetical protein [Lacibacter luteus]RXK57572.1 hypothetical protein ESA94_20450 [Lacibacter luteus]
MTADIIVGPYKPFKPHSFSWKRSIDSYTDSAVIKIPAVAVVRRVGDQYKQVQTGLQFAEGMKVEAYCGYDGNNPLRFKGFIRRVNFSVPLEIECEGYSYQLRKKEGYTKSYASTTVKQLLRDLCAGTDIVLSDSIPDIPLKNIYFKNVKGTDVLDYLKSKCLLTIYFNYEVLYCGLKMTEAQTTVKHRLNWNVLKDDQLKFEQNRELAKVTIQLEKRGKDGTKTKSKNGPKDGMLKILKVRHIDSEALMQQIAEEERKKLLFKGYEGVITTFLFPVVEPGMASQIDDVRYPERASTYFCEKVEGDFNSSGGRQKISIGAYLGS